MSHEIVSGAQFKQILDSQPSHPQDVVIVSKTEPDMRKTGNPYFGKVFKISTFSGKINWHYQSEVNHQRQREGGLEVVDGIPQIRTPEKFEALPRKWGTRLKDSPLVEHKGQFFLEIKVEQTIRHEYRDHENQPFDVEKIKPFMSSKSESSRQGVENEVILRDYRIDRIMALTFTNSGKTYLVNNATEVAEAA